MFDVGRQNQTEIDILMPISMQKRVPTEVTQERTENDDWITMAILTGVIHHLLLASVIHSTASPVFHSIHDNEVLRRASDRRRCFGTRLFRSKLQLRDEAG